MKACLFSVAVAAVVSLASAQGSIDNSAAQAQLMSQAVTLPSGTYTITNSDGTPMIYTRVGGQSYAPGGGSSSPISLESAGQSAMRISMGNTKCISAQWGGSFDWAGVLYVCAIGSGPIVRGLAPLKQHWLFIPAGKASTSNGVAQVARVQANAKATGKLSTSSSSSGSTAPTTVVKKTPKKVQPKPLPKCKKTRTWICRHPGYVKSAKSNHPECASLLARCPRSVMPALELSEREFSSEMEMEKRDLDLEKRQSSSNQYYIIAVDHLDDMTSRALTKGIIKTGDSASVSSWKLDEFQQGNADQIWTVTAA